MTRVSILMPMRNAADYVGQAVACVLAERQVPLELVVVDDRSTDDSATRVREVGDPRVRVIPGPGRGIAAAMNVALEAARGDIIMRCDADDLYLPGRIGRQVRWLDAHSGFGAVCGALSAIEPGGRFVADLGEHRVDEEITAELCLGSARTSFCTFAVRADVLRRIGGCRPYFVTAEDLDLQYRLASACRVWFEPVTCYHYRLHDASITHGQSTRRREFYERQAAAFARQRDETGRDDLDRGTASAPPPDDGAPGTAPGTAADQIRGMLLGRAWREHSAGRRGQALRTCWRACVRGPGNLATWRSMAAMLVPRRPDGQSEAT